ncbi:MAG: hypothetical protein MJY91_03855 [Bacteroidales bacterium]|nr:hypothetical protein [Bacteroidales bacterium]
MIPRVLHYCWYGRGEYPAVMRMCLDSWRKYCPDYEILEWNEDNTPMDISWIRDAYKHGKYAFCADYMRFYVLGRFGGVYLDTDVLLTSNIDSFLNHHFFAGREDALNVNFAVAGSEPGHWFCNKCIGLYDSMKFDLVHPPIITRLITPILAEVGLIEQDVTQNILNEGIYVYASSVFYPIHYSQPFELSEAMSYSKPGTVAIHLWNKSWKDEFQMFESGNWRLGFSEVRKRIKRTPFLPFSYWKKLVKYTGRYLGLWKR